MLAISGVRGSIPGIPARAATTQAGALALPPRRTDEPASVEMPRLRPSRRRSWPRRPWPSSYVAPAVPPGFVVETLTETLPSPWARAPAGRARADHRAEDRGDQGLGGRPDASPVGTVPGVNSGFERGLFAIAVDPGWPAPALHLRLVRLDRAANMWLSMFTVTGDLTNPRARTSRSAPQYDILTDVPDHASNHNGGSLRFGPDGMLYLSIGDDAQSVPRAGHRTRARVRSCRIDVVEPPGRRHGAAAQGDARPGRESVLGADRQRAAHLVPTDFAIPFRFHIDPVTGHLHIADVGAAPGGGDRRVHRGRAELRLAVARGEPERTAVHRNAAARGRIPSPC